MRWGVVLLALAACEPTPGAAPDARVFLDAMPRPPFTCGPQLPFAASSAHAVASDGSDVFVSIEATDGTMQIVIMPIAGGSATTLITGSEPFELTAADTSVFYPVRVGSSYELHQRAGGEDSVIGSIPALAGPALEIAANATDLYVLGPDAGSQTTLWRVPRKDTGNGAIEKVTTVAGEGSELALGTTLAAFIASAFELVDIPGPSTPTNPQNVGSNPAFVGDRGFVLTYSMQTQHQGYELLKQFVPTDGGGFSYGEYVWNGSGAFSFFTDEKYLYIQSSTRLQYLAPDRSSQGDLCNVWGGAASHDATHLFSVSSIGSSSWAVDILPKPL